MTTFSVPVGNDMSLARSEDMACHMEAVSWGNLAVVLARNLVITRGFMQWTHSYSCSVSGKSGTLSGGSVWWQWRRLQHRIRWRKSHNKTVSECR